MPDFIRTIDGHPDLRQPQPLPIYFEVEIALSYRTAPYLLRRRMPNEKKYVRPGVSVA